MDKVLIPVSLQPITISDKRLNKCDDVAYRFSMVNLNFGLWSSFVKTTAGAPLEMIIPLSLNPLSTRLISHFFNLSSCQCQKNDSKEKGERQKDPPCAIGATLLIAELFQWDTKAHSFLTWVLISCCLRTSTCALFLVQRCPKHFSIGASSWASGFLSGFSY